MIPTYYLILLYLSEALIFIAITSMLLMFISDKIRDYRKERVLARVIAFNCEEWIKDNRRRNS